MKNKNIIVAILVFVLALSMVSCSNDISNEIQVKSAVTQDDTSETQPLNNEINDTSTQDTVDDVHVFATSASRSKSYETLNDLNNNSDFIFTGECVSSEPLFQNETLYTLVQVKVENVYKGDLVKGDVVSLVEMGGRTTFGIYEKECDIELKAFEKESERLPSDTKIVIGLDGYYPMKTGEQVLLFAGDTDGFLEKVPTPLLGVMGAFDGKLIKQDDGSYKKPATCKEDKLTFDKKSLVITIQELDTIK